MLKCLAMRSVVELLFLSDPSAPYCYHNIGLCDVRVDFLSNVIVHFLSSIKLHYDLLTSNDLSVTHVTFLSFSFNKIGAGTGPTDRRTDRRKGCNTNATFYREGHIILDLLMLFSCDTSLRRARARVCVCTKCRSGEPVLRQQRLCGVQRKRK